MVCRAAGLTYDLLFYDDVCCFLLRAAISYDYAFCFILRAAILYDYACCLVHRATLSYDMIMLVVWYLELLVFYI